MPEAGYSGTPLPRKLGIKPGHRLALVDAPAEVAAVLTPQLPVGVETSEGVGRGRTPFDVILYFTDKRAALARQLPRLKQRLTPAGGLWLCWPKQASGVPTDLSDGVVRDLGLRAGLVDNKVCAVDQTWSGLRFVFHLADRPAAGTS